LILVTNALQVLDHTYELEGGYNWKILADNFNECYHCPTTHPDVPAFLNVETADVDPKAGHMQHDHASTPEQKAKGFNVNSTYYLPNVSMSVSPHWMMIQKFLPDGPKHSTMHYEVFRNKNSSEEDFKLIADMYARVMSQDKVLCDRAQKNLNAGVFINGEMHPRCEKGPLYFQSSIRDTITEHYRREKAAGKEIWPARQKLPDSAIISKEDLEMCGSLDCGTQREELVW
jgi:phenylpropionate dioxygenase-like ring-hydroxylating dioxygenase large terminal subunit